MVRSEEQKAEHTERRMFKILSLSLSLNMMPFQKMSQMMKIIIKSFSFKNRALIAMQVPVNNSRLLELLNQKFIELIFLSINF